MADTGRHTELVGGGSLTRFSSRLDRLSHVYLKDRLAGATEYCRIAGYFRSSIFDLVNEEIDAIPKVRIVCNSDLDPQDIQASKLAREQMLKERWNEVDDELEAFIRRPRYQRLYDLLKKGNVEVRVVSRADAPFLHGKAGVIRRAGGEASAFMGSLNETREGWQENYELVWEDTSKDGVEWVTEEFDYLWAKGKPLPDAIIEEIGRSARKQEVALADLHPDEVGPAALVEAPIYRRGEDLKSWQRSFVEMFLEHRDVYGKCRLLLADEVGVGKTLSLAGAALVSCLLGDGPTLILCPATLCQQWQTELSDKLGIPSAVWLSSKKVWQDHKGHEIKTRGAQDVTRCPYQIAIVSTGLIVHGTKESNALRNVRLGTLILDEAHKARRSRILGEDRGDPNNLLTFMQQASKNARHVLFGTATPIQTDVRELWDLLDALNRGAEHVLGRSMSYWRDADNAIRIITGEVGIENEDEAWELLRNPLPPRRENTLFDYIRSDLSVPDNRFFCDKPLIDVDSFTRQDLNDSLADTSNGLNFFRRNNPVVRHVVLRRRSTLEDKGLLPRIAVDIWPIAGNTGPMFEGSALRTSSEFDMAYEAVEKFTGALAKRKKSAGFMRNLLRQRICSSYASGLSTAEKLIESRSLDSDDTDQFDLAFDFADIIDEEVMFLEQIRHHLSSKPTDPKLEAVQYFLTHRHWLELGCIAFSQYYDTAYWVAENLAARLAGETVAVYAGAGKSGVFLQGDWRSADREQIKKAVREREIRLVIATDAACEGLNLQTLGTLINIDLPWNPSRLEQRIGRIKRFGQRRDRVDMLNLVYAGTVDEKVYRTLSARMKDRYDIFGSLPDVIEDEWIEDIEHLDDYLSQFTEKKKRANAFDIRYGDTVDSGGPGWEQCEKVLARSDVIERLSQGW